MTKFALKEEYKDWNTDITKKYKDNTEIYRQIQILNKTFGSGNIQYSLDLNLIEIIQKDNQEERIIHQALLLYHEYLKNEGRMLALRELALATNNFEI